MIRDSEEVSQHLGGELSEVRLELGVLGLGHLHPVLHLHQLDLQGNKRQQPLHQEQVYSDSGFFCVVKRN